MTPPLTTEERFWAKVDLLDSPTGCWLWTGATNSRRPENKRYGFFNTKKFPSKLVHRISWEMANGPIPAGLQVDHRHTCPKTCINPAHLRLATNKQNCENRAGAHVDSTSGIRGVTWNKRLKKWIAAVCSDGKVYHVGCYASIDEAAEAVGLKRLELFTHNDADTVISKKQT